MVCYPYERPIVDEIVNGLGLKKKLLHIITGPRQVGKTTAALQIADRWGGPVVNASADQALPPGPEWIEAHWQQALRQTDQNKEEVLLILDEIQKVKGWSEVIKGLWDKECHENRGIQVIILGSASLLIQKGLTESLTGRFFLYHCTHWGYIEMSKAFGWNMDQWLFYGGYPGAAPLIDQGSVWSRYVTDALIETVLAKDIFQLQTVAKPALLRNIFLLAAVHPAQILSYNKMLGQLQDAGNTTTLAHYLRLLESAFLISGLEVFKAGKLVKKGGSPKLIIWNNGLINALIGNTYQKVREDFSWWGRLVENAVGAHIINHLRDFSYQIYYWRHKGLEVDFVVKSPQYIYGIEVKSGRSQRLHGMSKFGSEYPNMKPIVIGPGHIEFEAFFSQNPAELFI
jgi:predicted AAA+ superfamily ATPase